MAGLWFLLELIVPLLLSLTALGADNGAPVFTITLSGLISTETNRVLQLQPATIASTGALDNHFAVLVAVC
jgi:hypothetical protein